MQGHIGKRSLFIYKIISFAKENFCNEKEVLGGSQGAQHSKFMLFQYPDNSII